MVFGLVWGVCLGCFGAVMGLCGFGYLVGCFSVTLIVFVGLSWVLGVSSGCRRFVVFRRVFGVDGVAVL